MSNWEEWDWKGFNPKFLEVVWKAHGFTEEQIREVYDEFILLRQQDIIPAKRMR